LKENDKEMQDGQLVLCDVGVKKHNLCSDITCTFPVNGKFTKEQKEIYDIVLDCQRAMIQRVQPGISYKGLHYESKKAIVAGLRSLGLLKGDLEELTQKDLGSYFYPHSLSHFIGTRTNPRSEHT
jgi:Xaa-Pro aminopeptidase